MKKEKVLFLDTVHPVLEQRLIELGYECDHAYDWPYEQVIKEIALYSGVVVRSRIPIDEKLIDHAKTLKFIARSGAGMENIAFSYAGQKGIYCINAPEGNRDAVGEHALAMLLALFNHLPKALEETRKGIWKREENRGMELTGKTVGIIGYGNTGSAFARKISGFDCKVLAYDKYKKGFGTAGVIETDMSTIFAEAEIISLHVPLTPETHHLVNTGYISQFARPFYLINTSRGAVVKTTDLTDALKAGKIAGACLDVLEMESSSFEQLGNPSLANSFQFLAAHERVILSPHVAGWTKESYYKLSAVLADKITALFHT